MHVLFFIKVKKHAFSVFFICKVMFLTSMRGTVIPNGLMFYFSLLTRNFRAPSADRRETLPRDRKMAEFGVGSLSMGGQEHAKFRSIL